MNLNYSPTQTSLALNPQNTSLGILPDSVQSNTATAVNFPYEFSVPNVKPPLVEETVGSLSCVAEQSYLQLPSSLKTEQQNSTINLATSELNKQLKQEFTNQFSGNSPSSNVTNGAELYHAPSSVQDPSSLFSRHGFFPNNQRGESQESPSNLTGIQTVSSSNGFFNQQ